MRRYSGDNCVVWSCYSPIPIKKPLVQVGSAWLIIGSLSGSGRPGRLKLKLQVLSFKRGKGNPRCRLWSGILPDTFNGNTLIIPLSAHTHRDHPPLVPIGNMSGT
jgi:hypothetical protein